MQIQSKPTLLMCANDYFAYYAMKFCQKYHVSVPDELSITGFDGLRLPPFLMSPKPDLTSVYGDRQALGAKSVDLIMGANDPKLRTKNWIMQTRLRLGESVRRLG